MPDILHSESTRLIARYGMQEHPEGGWYVECFRSEQTVQPDDHRAQRSALTTILFLLDGAQDGGISALHKVRSDEVWHHLDGDPIELVVLQEDFSSLDRAPLDRDHPVYVVPANHWQSARTTGHYTLVGCTVGPGFDFEDFTLLRSDAITEEAFIAHHPSLAHLL